MSDSFSFYEVCGVIVVCSIGVTYVYQEHISAGSFRLAPVSPEQGMKWMSFLGLKPTFLKNGTSFSLHSSYLKLSNTKPKHNSLCLNYLLKTQDIKDLGFKTTPTSPDSSSLWGRPFCWPGQSDAWLPPFWPTLHALVFDHLSQSLSQTHLSWQRSPVK